MLKYLKKSLESLTADDKDGKQGNTLALFGLGPFDDTIRHVGGGGVNMTPPQMWSCRRGEQRSPAMPPRGRNRVSPLPPIIS